MLAADLAGLAGSVTSAAPDTKIQMLTARLLLTRTEDLLPFVALGCAVVLLIASWPLLPASARALRRAPWGVAVVLVAGSAAVALWRVDLALALSERVPSAEEAIQLPRGLRLPSMREPYYLDEQSDPVLALVEDSLLLASTRIEPAPEAVAKLQEVLPVEVGAPESGPRSRRVAGCRTPTRSLVLAVDRDSALSNLAPRLGAMRRVGIERLGLLVRDADYDGWRAGPRDPHLPAVFRRLYERMTDRLGRGLGGARGGFRRARRPSCHRARRRAVRRLAGLPMHHLAA